MKNYLETIFTKVFRDNIADAEDAPVAGIIMVASLIIAVVCVFVSLWRALFFVLLAFIFWCVEVDNQKTRW